MDITIRKKGETMQTKKGDDNKVFINNFSNSLQISGLIATKPLFKEFTRKNGVVSLSASFILTQNFLGHDNKFYPKKYICTTRSPEIINELKTQEKQIYVTCLGKLDYLWDYELNKPYYYPLIVEMAIESICDEKMREK